MPAGSTTTRRSKQPQPETSHKSAQGVGDSIDLRVEKRPDGRWRFTPHALPQHIATATTPPEVARAIQTCFVELQCYAYARRRGIQPDTFNLSSRDSFDEPTNLGGRPTIAPEPPARSGHRRAGGWATGGSREQHPADYSPNNDGSWLSPSGRTIRDPEQCRRIVRRRRAAELPVTPDTGEYDLTPVLTTLVAAAEAAEQTPFEWLLAAVRAHAQPAPAAPTPVPAPAPVADLATTRAKRRRRWDNPDQLELDLALVTDLAATA